jgi:hypothetical protein
MRRNCVWSATFQRAIRVSTPFGRIFQCNIKCLGDNWWYEKASLKSYAVSVYRRLSNNVHFAKPESFYNSTAHGSFAAQNHIQVGPINAVPLREGDLTSFAFNCVS